MDKEISKMLLSLTNYWLATTTIKTSSRTNFNEMKGKIEHRKNVTIEFSNVLNQNFKKMTLITGSETTFTLKDMKN